MAKEFEAGSYWLEWTDKKEKPYCECFVPISIDKWFDRIHIKPEMNMLMQRICRKIGRLEGLTALKDRGELENINSLIGRINVMHARKMGISRWVLFIFLAVYMKMNLSWKLINLK